MGAAARRSARRVWQQQRLRREGPGGGPGRQREAEAGARGAEAAARGRAAERAGPEGSPPAERGRLRGTGAGARAGSRGGYDDPAAGPRISSPPPPPRGSPSSRLRTRHTGGKWERAGRVSGRERPPIHSPRRDRAGRGSLGKPGLRGTPFSGGPYPGPGAVSRGPASLGRGGDRVPREVRRLRACFRGNSPCLPPATALLGVLLSSNDRGPPGVSSLGRLFPGCLGRFPVCGLCVCISQLC